MSIRVHWCVGCRAEYLHFCESPIINVVSLYVTIHERLYRWTVTALGAASLWYIADRAIFGSKDKQRLLSLGKNDVQPIITPQNIAQKVQTYLIFL